MRKVLVLLCILIFTGLGCKNSEIQSVGKDVTSPPVTKEADFSNQVSEQKQQQDQIDALKKEIEDLKNQKPAIVIKEVPKINPSTNLVSIINQWRPRIAYIDCSWYGEGGLVTNSSGSGVLGPEISDGRYFIITNKHVVANEESNPATTCSIKFPDSDEKYIVSADLVNMTMEDISFSLVNDYGNIILGFKNLTQRVC